MSHSFTSARSSYSSDDGRSSTSSMYSLRRLNRLDLNRFHQTVREKLDWRKPDIKETVDPQVMQEAIERRKREKKHAEEQKNREKAEARHKKEKDAKNRNLREEAEERWNREGVATLVPKGERPTWRDHIRRMGRSRKGSEVEKEERYKHEPTIFRPARRDSNERPSVHVEHRHSEHSQHQRPVSHHPETEHSAHYRPSSSHHTERSTSPEHPARQKTHASSREHEVDLEKASSRFDDMREPLVHERKFEFPTPEEERQRKVHREEKRERQAKLDAEERERQEREYKESLRVRSEWLKRNEFPPPMTPPPTTPLPPIPLPKTSSRHDFKRAEQHWRNVDRLVEEHEETMIPRHVQHRKPEAHRRTVSSTSSRSEWGPYDSKRTSYQTMVAEFPGSPTSTYHPWKK